MRHERGKFHLNSKGSAGTADRIRLALLRIVAGLCLPLLAGACARAVGSALETTFDPAKQAIVVMGVTPAGQPELSTVSVKWSKFDPATGAISLANEFTWIYLGNPFDPDEARATQHLVFVVEPGDYILRHADVRLPNPAGAAVNNLLFRGLAPHMNKSTMRTSFATSRPTDGNMFDGGRVLPNSRAPRVTLRAGEAVYIGAHGFDFAQTPVRLVGASRDDAAAREELMRYPFGDRPLVYRAPRTQ